MKARETWPAAGVEITEDVRVFGRTDGKYVIYDRRLPLGENAGVYEDGNEAKREAKRKYSHELAAKPKTPAKQSAKDEEAFAAMKRAAANGFAFHEPAYSPEELAVELAPEATDGAHALVHSLPPKDEIASFAPPTITTDEDAAASALEQLHELEDLEELGASKLITDVLEDLEELE